MPNKSCMVLCKDSNANSLLISRIREIIPVAGVVIERLPRSARLNMLKGRYKKLGLLAVVDQLAYLSVRALMSLLGLYRNILALPAGSLSGNIDPAIPSITVESLNEVEVRRFIDDRRPSLVIVSGTSIIREELLEKISVPILNYHAGITPEYRGVYGGFWALYEGRPELAGSTIHFVDRGIDTGRIVRQKSVNVEKPGDDHISVGDRQFLLAVDMFDEIIREFLSSGEISSFEKPGSQSRLYYHPGLSH